MTVLDKNHQGGYGTGYGEEWRGCGKIWKLSEVNTRVVSRGQNELIGEFKMLAGDVISIREQVMKQEHTNGKKGMLLFMSYLLNDPQVLKNILQYFQSGNKIRQF